MNKKINFPIFAAFLACLALANGAFAQGTAFTYQGLLNAGGAPANGSYDIAFSLYATDTGGAAIGGPSTTFGAGVTNGVFLATLDFGPNSFTGAGRWLEIAVRTNAATTFFTLSPRQPITASPYAIFAGGVTAAGISGTITPQQLPTYFVTNGADGINISGTFAGDASGLTNIPANSLLGVTTNRLGVAWGDNSVGQTNVPVGLSNIVQVAVGEEFSVALRADGTVSAWGADGNHQTEVPIGLTNVIAIAAGSSHSLALKSDGTLATWGNGSSAVGSIPPGLSNVMAIAAGGNCSFALKTGGTLVAWGDNSFGQTNIPVGLSNVIAIAGGNSHSLALRSDGMVFVWGDNTLGQTNVPGDLSNVVAIAAGRFHNLALKSNGTVVAWGYDGLLQTETPVGLTNVIAVAAGFGHSLALKADGTLVEWGVDAAGQSGVPVGLTNVIALAQGCSATHALVVQKRFNPFISPAALLQGNNTFNGDVQINGNLQFSGMVTGSGGRFVILTNGWVGISNSAPTHLLTVGGGTPAYCDGTTWVNGSDRNAKQGFAAVDPGEVLEKVTTLPISRWQYKVDAEGVRHIGPMAQDFHEAFELNGNDDTHIATVDEGGVALAAIQGLNQKVEQLQKTLNEKDGDCAALKRENEAMKQKLDALQKLVQAALERP
jgi:hypothetical protein